LHKRGALELLRRMSPGVSPSLAAA
jgi:hypothetical protein